MVDFLGGLFILVDLVSAKAWNPLRVIEKVADIMTLFDSKALCFLATRQQLS